MVGGEFFKAVGILCSIQCVKCMNPGLEENIAQLLNAKKYLPDSRDLPHTSLIKTNENDSTYLLSKLSDEELLKLLNTFPQKSVLDDENHTSDELNNNQGSIHVGEPQVKNEPQSAVFRLDNREVDPFADTVEGDRKYKSLQKINNILYSRPQQDTSIDNNEKEMLFDILVAQLKTVCCKRNKQNKLKGPSFTKKYKSIVNKLEEYIFLVLNDEVKSNTSDQLIPVDPDSLAKNSSVLLLGPIKAPLSDVQTELVMSRIANELSKQEYLPLLHELSEGKLGKSNSYLVKSLISGPETRRFIKPHRCNHQSKLARVYGGPKWIICTGYLNINTPSLYD